MPPASQPVSAARAPFRGGDPGRSAGAASARRAGRRVCAALREHAAGCHDVVDGGPDCGVRAARRRLLIGEVDGVPVTGGAFQRFDAKTAELKRIWTDRAHRRRGFATALLAELESYNRRPRLPTGLPDDGQPPTRGRGALSNQPVTPGFPSHCRRGDRSFRSPSPRICA